MFIDTVGLKAGVTTVRKRDENKNRIPLKIQHRRGSIVLERTMLVQIFVAIGRVGPFSNGHSCGVTWT